GWTREEMESAMAAGWDLPLRSVEGAIADLFHRYSASYGLRFAPSRPLLFIYSHGSCRAFLANERERNLLSDGVGRQRAEHGALCSIDEGGRVRSFAAVRREFQGVRTAAQAADSGFASQLH